MLQVKSGDLDKLGLLFERYNRRLFGFFFRLTSRRDLSEDLVQGVFERILKYRHTYSDEGAFSTWLFQIARNLHIDHYRSSDRGGEEDNFVDPDTLSGDLPPPDGHPDYIGDPDRRLRLLKEAMGRLDPLKRETLVLSRYQGFKYREIAEIMDCSESAVKVRIFRALGELREIVATLNNEEYP